VVESRENNLKNSRREVSCFAEMGSWSIIIGSYYKPDYSARLLRETGQVIKIRLMFDHYRNVGKNREN
jgi:hypothetical protein